MGIKEIRKLQKEIAVKQKRIDEIRAELSAFSSKSRRDVCREWYEKKKLNKTLFVKCIETGKTTTLTKGKEYKLGTVYTSYIVLKGDSGVRNYYNPLYFKLCQ